MMGELTSLCRDAIGALAYVATRRGLQGRPLVSWRPELPGWSYGILEFYDRVSATLHRGAHVVEIGTDCGRSALFLASRLLAHGNSDARIYTIDPWWFEPDRPLAAPRGIRGPKLRALVGAATDEELRLIYPLRAESPGAAKFFDDASLALVFIDGAHDLESVRADIATWKPKVRPNGLLAGHDYSLAWPGVRRAVAESLSAYDVDQTVWSWRKT